MYHVLPGAVCCMLPNMKPSIGIFRPFEAHGHGIAQTSSGGHIGAPQTWLFRKGWLFAGGNFSLNFLQLVLSQGVSPKHWHGNEFEDRRHNGIQARQPY